MGEVLWKKLLRDVRAERARVALMVVAIAASLSGVGAVLGGASVLTRDIAANYEGTHPADATLELPGGLDDAWVAQARRAPGVADAEAREVVVGRARVGGAWRRVLLFVIDDFQDVRLNRFRRERGAWPPPDGTLLVERSALGVLDTELGGAVEVRLPQGAPITVPVTGVVHDPGLAPAWQERSGYVYLSRATLAQLGESGPLHELRVRFSAAANTAEVEARAATLAAWLAERDHPVSEIRVPPLGLHPHQRQMLAMLWMMLAFTALALVLSAVLVANSLSSLLARQVREIGVMKTLGARGPQIAALYAVLVGSIGGLAAVLALPATIAGTAALSGAVAALLNFELTGGPIPAWVFAVVVAAGVLVPLLVSAAPILQASRRTVREALNDHGALSTVPAFVTALPLPLRNALRRPTRLALTLGLLGAGGAMAVTALQVLRGWEATVAQVSATRSYDTEVVFSSPADPGVVDLVRALPGATGVEGWRSTPAAFARPEEVNVVRAYPDRGHGAFTAMGVPPETTLIHLPLRAGRWLEPADRQTNAVVLNHVALAQQPGLRVGDELLLSLAGATSTWRLVGVVEEIGSPGVAYVADEAFDRVTNEGGRLGRLRFSSSPSALSRLEDELSRAGVGVEGVQPLSELNSALGDHILVLVRVLMAIAGIFGVVGVLGLLSAMGVSVLERTRELAIMKTLGATPDQLRRLLLHEALAIAAVSFVLAGVLAVPLTLGIGWLVGTLGFLAPLPLVVSWSALGAWVLVGTVATVVATSIPARAAGRLLIREGLSQV